jgi:hypothetical protein
MPNYRNDNKMTYTITSETTNEEIKAALRRGDAVVYAGEQVMPRPGYFGELAWRAATLRAETRGNPDRLYWYAYRKVDGRLKKVYVGTQLTALALREAWHKMHPGGI